MLVKVGDCVVIEMWLLGGEDSGCCDLRLQCLEGFLQHFLTQLFFTFVGLARVSDRVRYGLALDDSAGPDSLG